MSPLRPQRYGTAVIGLAIFTSLFGCSPRNLARPHRESDLPSDIKLLLHAEQMLNTLSERTSSAAASNQAASAIDNLQYLARASRRDTFPQELLAHPVVRSREDVDLPYSLIASLDQHFPTDPTEASIALLDASRRLEDLAQQAGRSRWQERLLTTTPKEMSEISDIRNLPFRPPDIQLSALQGWLAQLAHRFTDQRSRERLADSFEQVTFMQRRWEPHMAASDEQIKAFELDLFALNVASLETNDTKALAIVEEVTEDIKLKAEHCLKSGAGLGRPVLVTVETLRTGRRIMNLQVTFIPKILEFQPNPERWGVFPKESSPTSLELAPGKYLMWTRYSGTDTYGPPTIVSVGRGKTTQNWDLPAPPPK